jgi:hypothetical protein
VPGTGTAGPRGELSAAAPARTAPAAAAEPARTAPAAGAAPAAGETATAVASAAAAATNPEAMCRMADPRWSRADAEPKPPPAG